MPLLFRVARSSDAEDLATLVNSSYRGESSRSGWTTEADLFDGERTDASSLRHEMATPQHEFHLARDESGAAVACFRYGPDPLGSPAAYVGMIAVTPTRQGAGLGRQVLAAAEQRARDDRRPALVMWALDARTELIAYYARRGYVDTGERVPFPYGDVSAGRPRRDDLSFAVLRKEL